LRGRRLGQKQKRSKCLSDLIIVEGVLSFPVAPFTFGQKIFGFSYILTADLVLKFGRPPKAKADCSKAGKKKDGKEYARLSRTN
jgi:hypothetical protein